MVSAITVGTNSYVTVAEADTILGDLVHTAAWQGTNGTLKAKALITAFGDLSAEGFVDPDTGEGIDPADAPTPIKTAQSELAFEYSQDSSAATSRVGATNTKRVKAGSAEVEFFKDQRGTKYSSRVSALIAPYLPTSANSTLGSNSFGTDAESSFTDTYGGINDGFA